MSASWILWSNVKVSRFYPCDYKQPVAWLDSHTAEADSARPKPQYKDNYGNDGTYDIAGDYVWNKSVVLMFHHPSNLFLGRSRHLDEGSASAASSVNFADLQAYRHAILGERGIEIRRVTKWRTIGSQPTVRVRTGCGVLTSA